AAGWYTGRVDVVALGVGTQAVEVVLRLNHRPGVAWDAGSKVWTNEVMAGGSIAGTTVAVWNASATPRGHMNYQLSVLNDSFGWVSVSPASGVSTGDHQVATVSYTTTGLVAGVYTAQLKVAGVDAATGEATTNGPLIMGLQLTVNGTPALKTDVTSLSQTVLENHTGTNSFLVWNEGREPHGGMRYTVTPDVSWVTVSPATGVVTNNVNSVQVVWGTTGTTLPPGVYSGNLVVDAFDAQTSVRAGGAPLTIPLTLTVTVRTPLNMELPTVVGTMYIGQTVEANVGLWQNQARLTFGYQWERASNKAGGGWEALGGKVSYTNDITTGDRGKYLRVKVTATDATPFPKSSTANSAWVDAAKVKALRADFNGDGITDLWFYNTLSGVWYASFGETSSAEGIFPGGPGMLAMPGDYDGDGYEDLGVYEWAHGMWHICYLPRGDYVYGSLFGGTAEEAVATPVAADFDGDGATDVGLYYMGYWAILYSSLGSVSVVEPFADAWGEPVFGDWDGDGITEMGVYDDGVWTLRMGNGSVVEQEFGGGGSGVLPAPGDYDADGATDLGVYDVGANQWRWRESLTGFEQSVSFGSGGEEAMPGYYDHDRSNDWAQVHMSADNDFIVWEVKRTTETNFPYRGQSFQQSTDRWRVSW
ncbi:MAG: VCBS repeat-containing protein, partial [Verrucomicrobia bacterium]|nr:VCBS repeat-containing protein [Verrucomicrobiota bacterium]